MSCRLLQFTIHPAEGSVVNSNDGAAKCNKYRQNNQKISKQWERGHIANIKSDSSNTLMRLQLKIIWLIDYSNDYTTNRTVKRTIALRLYSMWALKISSRLF